MKVIKEVYESLIYDIKKTNKKCFGYLYSDASGIIKDYYIFQNDSRASMALEFIVFGDYYCQNHDAGFSVPIEEMITVEKFLIGS